jgi:hypothetical protein
MSIPKLFSILFVLCSFQVHAQQIEWGNPQKLKQKNLYNQIIGESGGSIFLLRGKDQDFRQDLIIEKYKNTLALDVSIPLPLSVNGSIERVLLMNDELFIFISAKNTLNNQIDLLVQKLDLNFKPLGNPQVLCSMSNKSFLEKRNIQIKPNANKSSFGIMFISLCADDKGILNLYQYDLKLQQKFGKQFNLGEDEKGIFISAFDLSNSGETFIMIDYPLKNYKGERDDPRKFFLYVYYPTTDKILEYDLLGKDSFFIEELGMCLNNYNQTISVTGLYSENAKIETKGYFYRRYNFISSNLEHSYSGLFDVSFLNKLSSAKIEKFDPDLNDFYIRKIVPRSDGGLVVLAEKFFQTRQTYTYYVNNFPQTSTRIVYNFDETAIYSINPDGKIQFNELIKKHQSSVGDGGYFSSIISIPTLDNIQIIYNSEGSEQSDIALHTINYQGRFETKTIVKSANTNAAVIPTEFKQISANTGIICAIRDKRFTLMRITF